MLMLSVAAAAGMWEALFFHFQLCLEQLWIYPAFQESCLFTGYIKHDIFYTVLSKCCNATITACLYDLQGRSNTPRMKSYLSSMLKCIGIVILMHSNGQSRSKL